MNRILLVATLIAGGGAGVFCTSSLRHQAPARQNVQIGPVQVGGMSPDDAARAVRSWWETEKVRRLKLQAPGIKAKLPALHPSELGVTIDDVNSVRLAMDPTTGAADGHNPPVFRATGISLRPLESVIAKAVGAGKGPRVRYQHGMIVRTPGAAGVELDETALPERVGKAILGDGVVELPLKTGQPGLSNEALDQITDVVASFSTRFSTSKRTRCSNIKLAAHLIDGTVIAPGERFSFNGVVGRRTLKAGFKVAGVYINGQHDTGIGGGICQVSTTLYNAALLSNLEIRRRSNHSLPVPYVPLGRDATVDYGNLDLVFENPYPTPIAISSEYHPGQLTFRILGKKPAGMTVKIVRGPMTWKEEEIERIPDAGLPVGQHRVLKPGSASRAVSTIRVVYMDGKVVKREPLGRSYYGGQTRVVAYGTKAPVPSASRAPAAAQSPLATPAVAPPARIGGNR